MQLIYSPTPRGAFPARPRLNLRSPSRGKGGGITRKSVTVIVMVAPVAPSPFSSSPARKVPHKHRHAIYHAIAPSPPYIFKEEKEGKWGERGVRIIFSALWTHPHHITGPGWIS